MPAPRDAPRVPAVHTTAAWAEAGAGALGAAASARRASDANRRRRPGDVGRTNAAVGAGGGMRMRGRPSSARSRFGESWGQKQTERFVRPSTRSTFSPPRREAAAARPVSAPARRSAPLAPHPRPNAPVRTGGVAEALGRPASTVPAARPASPLRRGRPLTAHARSSAVVAAPARKDADVRAEAQLGLERLRARVGARFSSARASELSRVFGCGHGAVSLAEFRRGLARLGVMLSEPASLRLFESADRTRSGYLQPTELAGLVTDAETGSAKDRAASARLRVGVAGASPLSPRPPVSAPPFGVDAQSGSAWVGVTGARRQMLRANEAYQPAQGLEVTGMAPPTLTKLGSKPTHDNERPPVLPGPSVLLGGSIEPPRRAEAEAEAEAEAASGAVASEAPAEAPAAATRTFLGKPLKDSAERDVRVTSVALAVEDKIRERSGVGARRALKELTGGAWAGTGAHGVAVTARDMQRTIVSRLHIPCGLDDAELVVANLVARSRSANRSPRSPRRAVSIAIPVATEPRPAEIGLTWSDLTSTFGMQSGAAAPDP